MPWRRKKQREQDLSRELDCHLDLEAAEQQENGFSTREARYAAQRIFGNKTIVEEQVRDMWGWNWLERFKQDLGYAMRVFANAPGFTGLVILTLTLGIGANTAIFSVLNTVLLQPLPYRDSSRLVVMWDREIHVRGTSKLFDLYTDYENWTKNSQSFASLAAFSWAPQVSPSRILTGMGKARSVFTLPVTADFFEVLGTHPILGRTFADSDTGRGCAVVLAGSFWKSAFGGQQSAIGRSIQLDGQACTILGVMPLSFAFLPPEQSVSMWILIPPPARPDELAVGIFGRLRPNISSAVAQAELSSLHRQLHKSDLWGKKVQPIVYGLHDEFTWLTGRNLRMTLLVLFGAVSFVLLICCVNVANLLLGRSIGREREMAIRAALGCSRYRLLRQLLTENLVLSIAATLCGTALAWSIIQYLKAEHPIEIPPAATLGINAPVLAFAASLSVVTLLFFGLLPAWRASQTSADAVLKAAGRTGSQTATQRRLANGLVVVEVMLTVILLSGAGLLTQTLNRFASATLGFQPDGLVTAALSIPDRHYATVERRLELFDRIGAGLKAIPGIEAVAFSSSRPISGGGETQIVEVEGHPEPRFDKAFDTYRQTVNPDYFRTLRIPLMEGRAFERRDNSKSEPVAIVNKALVRRYFPAEDPIGKHIRSYNKKESWLRVVGVVGNERRTTVYQEMAWADSPVIYRPLEQDPLGASHLILRTEGDPSSIAAGIQHTMNAIDRDIPVEEIQTVRNLESKQLAYPRFRAALVGAFASLGLILAVVGLFGTLAQLVAQRTREIGIRMALGAHKRDVVGLVIWQGVMMTGLGLVIGLGAASELAKVFSGLLYGVRGADPRILAGVAALFLIVATLTAYLPARRAASIDPMEALRYE